MKPTKQTKRLLNNVNIYLLGSSVVSLLFLSLIRSIWGWREEEIFIPKINIVWYSTRRKLDKFCNIPILFKYIYEMWFVSSLVSCCCFLARYGRHIFEISVQIVGENKRYDGDSGTKRREQINIINWSELIRNVHLTSQYEISLVDIKL